MRCVRSKREGEAKFQVPSSKLLSGDPRTRGVPLEFGTWNLELKNPSGFFEFIRVIRAAHHRPARHVDESHFSRSPAVLGEFLRRDEFHDRQMLQRRLKILSQRQD